jgi:selenophosphate synthase
MAKFLIYKTAANGEFLIPQNGFVTVLQASSVGTDINYVSPNDKDQLRLVHAADTGKIVQDFIKDKFKEMAETSWTNAIIDITADCPIEITDIILG